MSTISNPIGIAVCDSSYKKAGSYWQWADSITRMTWESKEEKDRWESVAQAIHAEWPVRMGEFKDQEAILYGVLMENGHDKWLYRVYPAGLDKAGRRGRYFFVVFRLRSAEQSLLPEVAGVLRYFDLERNPDLRTEPLDNALPWVEPDEFLVKLHKQWVSGKHGNHWGMDGTGKVIEFLSKVSFFSQMNAIQPGETTKAASVSKSFTQTRLKLVLVLLIVAIIGIYGCSNVITKEHDRRLSEGRRMGFEEGKKEGYDEGYREGKAAGFKLGRSNSDSDSKEANETTFPPSQHGATSNQKNKLESSGGWKAKISNFFESLGH